jgi:acetyl esterase
VNSASNIAFPRRSSQVSKLIIDVTAAFYGRPARRQPLPDRQGTPLALKARAARRPHVGFQLLVYPDLDFRRTNSSITEFAGKYGNISRAAQAWFMDHYLTTEDDKLDPWCLRFWSPT